MIERRTVLRLFAGSIGATLVPGHLFAQPRLPRLAIIDQIGPLENMGVGGSRLWDAFFRELAALGHVDGRTIRIERWIAPDQTNEGFARVARSVVETQPDVIAVSGLRLILACREATTTIPIVGQGGIPDDINYGHPGGNVTGVAGTAGDMDAKIVQFLQEALSGAQALGWLGIPDTWNGPVGLASQAGAASVGISLEPHFLDSPLREENIREVMGRMATDPPPGLIVSPLQALVNFAPLVAELALEAGLPAIALHREYVDAGLLMFYGADPLPLYRRWAAYIDMVLDGSDPGQLPIEQPSKIDLVINLGTAERLGLTLPQQVLTSATEFIQ